MKPIVIALAGVLAGCVQTATIQGVATETELAPFRQAGIATVSGQGFLRQQGGGIVTCAGSQVALMPDLAPMREAIQLVRQGKQVSAGSQSWGNAVRRTTCDAQGNFEFRDLPPASWWLTTEVRWTVGYATQGGVLARNISTASNVDQRILLTDGDRL